MSSVASISSSALTPQTSLESVSYAVFFRIGVIHVSCALIFSRVVNRFVLYQVISSNSSTHEETATSHWSRLRHRLHDVGSRRKRENNTNPINRPKLGSLVKLATKERKHQSARRMGSLNTQLNQVKRGETRLYGLYYLLLRVSFSLNKWW
jgi:hypothetical protein